MFSFLNPQFPVFAHFLLPCYFSRNSGLQNENIHFSWTSWFFHPPPLWFLFSVAEVPSPPCKCENSLLLKLSHPFLIVSDGDYCYRFIGYLCYSGCQSNCKQVSSTWSWEHWRNPWLWELLKSSGQLNLSYGLSHKSYMFWELAVRT